MTRRRRPRPWLNGEMGNRFQLVALPTWIVDFVLTRISATRKRTWPLTDQLSPVRCSAWLGDCVSLSSQHTITEKPEIATAYHPGWEIERLPTVCRSETHL